MTLLPQCPHFVLPFSRYNSIRYLPANSFRGLHIQIIDLLNNVLSSIHPGAFRGLENSLTSLSLQMYAYRGLPVDALSGLNALTHLVIRGCRSPVLNGNHFKNVPFLEELHLVGCRIRDVAHGTFDPLVKLRKLNLADNLLSEGLLRNVNRLPYLWQLDLSSNRIRSLQISSSWIFPKLKSLNLEGNRLSSLSTNILDTLQLILEDLNVSNNELSDEDVILVQKLRSLRRLNLSNNNISSLSLIKFWTLSNLHDLNIANNNVARLPSSALQGLESSLKILDLHGNPLSTIGPGLLNRLKYLQSLNISHTKVGSFYGNNEHLLEGLVGHFTTLDISNSGLITSNLKFLHGLRKLNYVNLSFNFIAVLDLGLFSAWPKLKSVNLSHNNISVLSGTIYALSDISRIDLSWNQIRSFEKCAFSDAKVLKMVALNNNPLSCSCENAWLFFWHQRFNGIDIEPWRCHSPVWLKYRTLADLSFSDFQCANVSKAVSSESQCTQRREPVPRTFFAPPRLSSVKVVIGLDLTQNCSARIHWHMDHWGDSIHRFRIILKPPAYLEENNSVGIDDMGLTFPREISEHTLSQAILKSTEQICVEALDKLTQVSGSACRRLGRCFEHCLTSKLDIVENVKLQSKQLEATLKGTFLPVILLYVTCSLALGIAIAVSIVCVCKAKSKALWFLSAPFWNARRPNCFEQRTSVASSLPVSNSDSLRLSDGLQTLGRGCTAHSGGRRRSSETVSDVPFGLHGQYLSYTMTRDVPKLELSRNLAQAHTHSEVVDRRRSISGDSRRQPRPSQNEVEENEDYFFYF